MRQILTVLFALFVSAQGFGAGWGTTPSTQLFLLTNQFGEQSINKIQSPQLTLTNDFAVLSSASTPVNGGSGTGVGYAGKGSICSARDTGVVYSNTGTKASPTWSATGTTTNAAVIAATLTAFAPAAGAITSADSVLSAIEKLAAGSLTPSVETVSAAGAISTTVTDTTVSNGTGGTYAVTLAAPSSQDGQFKIIKMGTATHTVTLAMTNIAIGGGYTARGTTTLTFTSTGDSVVLMAVGSKWVYLGGTAVAS